MLGERRQREGQVPEGEQIMDNTEKAEYLMPFLSPPAEKKKWVTRCLTHLSKMNTKIGGK